MTSYFTEIGILAIGIVCMNMETCVCQMKMLSIMFYKNTKPIRNYMYLQVTNFTSSSKPLSSSQTTGHRLLIGQSWLRTPLKSPIVCLSQKCYHHCLVQVCSRNGLYRDFTIELKQIEDLAEDRLNCQINLPVKPRRCCMLRRQVYHVVVVYVLH